jgi:hypothetical protein
LDADRSEGSAAANRGSRAAQYEADSFRLYPERVRRLKPGRPGPKPRYSALNRQPHPQALQCQQEARRSYLRACPLAGRRRWRCRCRLGVDLYSGHCDSAVCEDRTIVLGLAEPLQEAGVQPEKLIKFSDRKLDRSALTYSDRPESQEGSTRSRNANSLTTIPGSSGRGFVTGLPECLPSQTD